VSDEFDAAIEDAKRMEKKLLEYAPYEGDIAIERTMDLEPKEYVDLNYSDLLNLYERSRKIISTAGLGILAKTEEEATPKAESVEVESKLREMTSETLKTAEEVAKEPIALEREAPPQAEAPKAEAVSAKEAVIQFETRPAERMEFEIEKEKPSQIELEKEEPKAPQPARFEMEGEKEKPTPSPPSPLPSAIAPARVEEARIEAPVERKVIVAAVPPALRESPDKAAAKRYEQMEEQIRAAVGEKADEMTLKKKMLDLTKELFKEKTTGRREEIKLQITVLKNMLAGIKAGGTRPAPKKGEEAGETHLKLFDTIMSTQQGELAQTKDTIIDSYNKQIASIKKKFYEDVSGTDDPAKRKQTFEAFVFSVESLVEQLPEVLGKYKEFTSKKHAAELEKVLDSLGPEEKEMKAKVKERLDHVRGNYDQEFASVKGILAKSVENLIEVAGSEILKKPQASGKPKEAEESAYEIVKEINETDEGTLLYFLHTREPEYYKRYERKTLSKAEAIFKAKELMAKDKGLGADIVKKYFGQTEG